MRLYDSKATAEAIASGIDLSGKSIVLTGSSSGIGKETLRVLTKQGAHVYALARSLEKAKSVSSEINGNITPVECDLSDVESISNAAKQISEPVDIIIANAGVMAIQNRTTINGVEAHMFINHFAHFILISDLLPKLSQNGRIVIVSSGAHTYARGEGIIWDDLRWDRKYSPWSAYGHSKLANILFAKALAKRMKKGQVANALHPGVIKTPLWRHLDQETKDNLETSLTLKSVGQGAAATVFLAASPNAATLNGEYISGGEIGKPSDLALEPESADMLWEKSWELLNEWRG